MTPIIRQFGKTEYNITFSPDPLGDMQKVLMTETRRIHIDVDALGRKSAVLKDEVGRIIAILVNG